jgi:hypothetical protein
MHGYAGQLPESPMSIEAHANLYTYTTTHRNKTVNVDKIKHIFIVLVLLTKSVFKEMLYTTYID